MKPRIVWAAMWRSENKLSGKTLHLLYEDCLPKLFRTRQLAREYIEKKFGYIRERKDLQREPHGWKMPIPVRVSISLSTFRETK